MLSFTSYFFLTSQFSPMLHLSFDYLCLYNKSGTASMKNINKELFSLILMMTSGILILGLAVGIAYAIKVLLSLEHGIWYIAAYLALYALTYYARRKSKNNLTNYLYLFLSLPFRAIGAFVPVALPYFVLQIHLLIYLFFSSIVPLFFYVLDRETQILNLKITTHIYLIVTFSVITATLMNKQMKHLTYLFSPIRLYSAHISKRFDFNSLTNYFLSEHTIKFIIYFCYFLYLLIFNLFTFQEHSLYSSPLMDRAVLQSFITFLALERLISNLKDLDFKPSEMLKLLLTSISGSDKDEDINIKEKDINV